MFSGSPSIISHTSSRQSPPAVSEIDPGLKQGLHSCATRSQCTIALPSLSRASGTSIALFPSLSLRWKNEVSAEMAAFYAQLTGHISGPG